MFITNNRDFLVKERKDVEEYNELKAKGQLAENEPEVLDCGKYAGMTTMEAREAIVV